MIQKSQMTKKDQKAIYMKMKKSDIVDMLIESTRVLNQTIPSVIDGGVVIKDGVFKPFE